MPDTHSATKPATEPPQQQKLYADHVKIQSRRISGTFRNLKWWAMGILLGIYYIAPWIRWDRGADAPDQAILLDIAGRRAYFFFIEIWPQEVYYLTGILAFCAVGLFFVTALLGRVWCGFTCPQTVWTDLYIWVERLVEGDRNARLKLDAAPMSLSKVYKRVLKHSIWMLIALVTGGAWIFYFVDAPTAFMELVTFQASEAVIGFIALFTFTTYLLAGWAREQVCIYMCPWPRFQGAMFDEDTLVVTYEEWRGEPRGGARKGSDFDHRGHCVDCGLCVQVCPTGTDIRQGNQMSCIGCGLCIDACNTIMPKFGLPGNLITYDSVNNQLSRMRKQPEHFTFFRRRTFMYLVVLGIITAVMLAGLTTRSRLEINMQRDRAPLFVTLSDGSIRNGYTYKILNMEREAKTYELTLDGVEGATMTVIGVADKPVPTVTLQAKPDQVATFKIYVRADRAALEEKSEDITFVLRDKATGEIAEQDTVFVGPGR
ncbi:MAG: cytochrome c oxidase accessory protein CcoG [Magnetovibrionaceae bacterium]